MDKFNRILTAAATNSSRHLNMAGWKVMVFAFPFLKYPKCLKTLFLLPIHAANTQHTHPRRRCPRLLFWSGALPFAGWKPHGPPVFGLVPRRFLCLYAGDHRLYKPLDLASPPSGSTACAFRGYFGGAVPAAHRCPFAEGFSNEAQT